MIKNNDLINYGFTGIRKISWSKIELLCNKIVSELKKKKIKIDLIIAISRGGLIPSVIISHKINKFVLPIVSNRYSVANNRIKIKNQILIIPKEYKKYIEDNNILIIDDIVGEGKTIEGIVNGIKKMKSNKIYTVSLFKNINRFKSNINLFYVGENVKKYLVFPWEKK